MTVPFEDMLSIRYNTLSNITRNGCIPTKVEYEGKQTFNKLLLLALGEQRVS